MKSVDVRIVDVDGLVVPKTHSGLRSPISPQSVLPRVGILTVLGIPYAVASFILPLMFINPLILSLLSIVALYALGFLILFRLSPKTNNEPSLVNPPSGDPFDILLKSMSSDDETYIHEAQKTDFSLAVLNAPAAAELKNAIADTEWIKNSPRSQLATPPEKNIATGIVVKTLNSIAIAYGTASALFFVYNVVLYFNLVSPIHSSSSVIQWLLAPIFYLDDHHSGRQLRDAMMLWLALLIGPPIGCAFVIRRLSIKTPHHLLEFDVRPSVLYLRPFRDDRCLVRLFVRNGIARVRFEAALAHFLDRLGPLIALGSPRDRLPREGAARAYIDGEVWHTRARNWMANCRLIVFLMGAGDGLDWEIGEIRRLGLSRKTVILFPPCPPLHGIEGYRMLRRWRADRELRWRSFRESFPEFSEALKDVPLESDSVLAVWMTAAGVITVVRAIETAAQEYEVAIRLAISELGLLLPVA